MSPRKVSLRVAHGRSCPSYSQSSVDSLKGCKCQPSYFTMYTDRNGAQVRSARVKNRRVAERAMGKTQVELDENRAGVAQAKSKTFNEWLPIWAERVEAGGRLSAESVRQYSTTAKLAAEEFGNHGLREIGDDELFSFVKECQRRKLKPRTIDKHLRHLHGLFQAAIGARLLGENPVPVFRTTFKLALEPSAPNYFTGAELGLLWRQFAIGVPRPKDDKTVPVPAVYLHLAKFAVATGVRLGELAAITWGDVDLSAGTYGEVTVSKSSHQRDGITKAKTRSSHRTVHLLADARRVLETWTPVLLETHGAEAIADTALVFPAPQGGRIAQGYVANKVMTPVMKAASVTKVGDESPEPRSFHTFRHCYARLCLAPPVSQPLQWVSNELGHASTLITEQVYGHWTKETKQDLAAAVKVGVIPV